MNDSEKSVIQFKLNLDPDVLIAYSYRDNPANTEQVKSVVIPNELSEVFTEQGRIQNYIWYRKESQIDQIREDNLYIQLLQTGERAKKCINLTLKNFLKHKKLIIRGNTWKLDLRWMG